MCSTPKPKRKIKAKNTNSSFGILSSMSDNKRRDFALRANQASEHRIEMEKLKLVRNRHLNNKNTNTKKKAKTVSSWLYNLLNTSVSDIANRVTSKLLRSIASYFFIRKS